MLIPPHCDQHGQAPRLEFVRVLQGYALALEGHLTQAGHKDPVEVLEWDAVGQLYTVAVGGAQPHAEPTVVKLRPANCVA